MILVHEHLDRAAQLATALARQGAPVAVHVDRRVRRADHAAFAQACAGHPTLRLVARRSCEWGGFGLVRATMASAAALLDGWPEVRHVCLLSGSCLPVRPLGDLEAFLAANPDTDFIESVDLAAGGWVQDGLSMERLSLWFPFSWRRQRRLFDGFVALQRRLGVRRRVPSGLTPHVGSQWWCLTRRTLSAMLQDPQRRTIDRFFAWSWIPDETYFQTQARRHSSRLESRSLTLCRFDHQGKPHCYHDDHAELLRLGDHFFARKIWHGAEGLYRRFLGPGLPARGPRFSGHIPARPFAAVREERTRGRPGQLSAGRFPCRWFEDQPATPGPYLVLDGFDCLAPGWHRALGGASGSVAHGRVFAPDRVELAGDVPVWAGNIPANPAIRDRAPEQYWISLLRQSPAGLPSLQLAPGDDPRMRRFVARDPRARILRLADAWLIDIYRASGGEPDLALRLIERVAPAADATGAAVEAWSLADAIASPAETLAQVARRGFGDEVRLVHAPPAEPAGLGAFAAALGHPQAGPLREAEAEFAARARHAVVGAIA